MHVQLGVVADHANVAKGGKLNVLGVFDTIAAPSFPVVHPFMVLALRFRFEYGDGPKSHKLEITLEDEDGKRYMTAEAQMQVPAINPGRVHHMNQVINLVNMGFGREGRYAFHIRWDGEEKDRVDLFLIKQTKATK